MKALVTADIHCTDDPNEEFRWNIFKTLEKLAKEHCVDKILLLGDLTAAKNNHSDVLINKMTSAVASLTKYAPVTILKGNHDWDVDPNNAFFKFLGEMKDVEFIDQITEDDDTLWLPHTRDTTSWKDIDFSRFKYIYSHQCYIGATSNNGFGLSEGTSPHIFDDTDAIILAGDIHVPQRVGNVTYVGAPARFNYGDTYTPRVIIQSGSRLKFIDIKVPLKHKLVVDSADDLASISVSSEDTVRIELRVNKDNVDEWRSLKDEVTKKAAELGMHVESIQMSKRVDTAESGVIDNHEEMSTEEVVKAYGERNELSEAAINAGLQIIKGE